MLRRGKLVTNKIVAVRELRREELSLLRETRPRQVLQKLRDPHHHLARLIAIGKPRHEAARLSGYSYIRVNQLMIDPSFVELVAQYRKEFTGQVIDEVDAYMQLLMGNAVKSERMIAERLEEADEGGEQVPMKDLLAISRDSADRIGYGKKQTNVNVNVDFAARLERAISRSGLKVIGRTLPPLEGGSAGCPPTQPAAEPPFRRIA